MIADDYHPHYPDAAKDHTRRVLWFALVLQTAKEVGIRDFLAMNLEHRQRVEAVIGVPTFNTIKV